MASRSGSNGSNSLENDILLTPKDVKPAPFQGETEADSKDGYQGNALQRCSRKIRKETWFVILTLIGVAIGVLLGTTIRLSEPSQTAVTLIAFPGELFMRMLKMVIVPVLFTSVVVGLSSIDYKRSGKMWLHCFVYYISTTVLATVLGIVLVTLIHPGNPRLRESNFEKKEQQVISTMDSFLDLLRNLIPDNIIAACFQVTQTKFTKVESKEIPSTSDYNITSNETEVLYSKSSVKVQNTNALDDRMFVTLEGSPLTSTVTMFRSLTTSRLTTGKPHRKKSLMVFAIFFGVTISSLRKEAKIVADFMESINKIFMRMIMIILWFSPLGISSLIAGNLLKMKSITDVVNMLGMYMATVITGLIIHCFITIPLIYFIVTRKNPFKLYYGVLQALFTAFGTSSSIGTLPLTMKCLENNVGIDKRVSRFVLPLGATMNMDGTAVMEGVAAITIAQMYEMNLSAGQLVTISITATLTSIGAAAIPSAGLVMLLIVLNAIGVPSDVVGLLWSIDWFLDRLRTMINILGDSIGAGVVDHLNKDILQQQDTALEPTAKPPTAPKELCQFYDSGVSVSITKRQENMI